MHKEVDFLIINNTTRPRTGGDYVYTVMRNELTRQGYKVFEIAVPLLIDYLKCDYPSWIEHTSMISAEIVAYFLCYLSSFQKFMRGSRLMITSSCPTFPVFGHLTYHQPKAGIFTDFRKESDSIKRKIGYRIEENETLSPLWLLVKSLLRLHLSNSNFTKELVKKIYGINSKVLYPPVPIHNHLRLDLHGKRKPYILVSRPEATTGIALLPEIAKYLPNNVKLIIIGNIDRVGLRALRILKDSGTRFEYLGYVKEELKTELFRKCSVYLNLAVNETFGITVVEALAAGCVPISHDSGAIPEYLPQELRYSNFDEAAEKVAMYINFNNELRKELRKIALKFEEARFREKFMIFLRQLDILLQDKN